MTKRNEDAREAELLVKRLLGSGEPEVSCEQCFELLDEYVELENAGASADEHIQGMRAHLEGCAACREEHDSLLALLTDDNPG